MSRRRVGPAGWLAVVVAGLAVVAPARGQGLIVDRRPHVPVAGSFEVRSIRVDAKIRDQVAEVQVSQTFHNPGSFELEAEFLFPVAEGVALQNLVLLVDGRELTGQVMNKDEARRIYEEIVRSKRDPALLEYMGRGLVRTAVFPIPAGADRTVTFRFTQVCPRDRDVVEFVFPLAGAQATRKPVGSLEIVARVESKEPIKSVYSPQAVAVERRGDHEATVRHERRDEIPTGDFQVVYTLAEGAVGASVLSTRPSAGDDGYALVLASPRVEGPRTEANKTVLFVLDRSGSMTGKKIEQARNALKFVLENLRDGDTFNVIAYDDRVETYKAEIQRFTPESKAEALRFVENIEAGGSTNISEALTEALKMVPDGGRPSYVLFLTDGLPTAGETDEGRIVKIAAESNPRKARVFAFGVGDDVNARLLDRLSGDHGGTSDYVRPSEDIEAKVSAFFRKLTSPVLSDIKLTLEGVDLNRGYPRTLPDLFEGGQIVWVGRYRDARPTKLILEGKVGDETRRFEFPVELAKEGEGSRYHFVETLWAVRRVGDLIDQVDMHGANAELTDELVALGKKYGILTPYTSFLADERTNLNAASLNRGEAETRLRMLGEVQGNRGVAQRAIKGQLQYAENAAGVDAYARRQLATGPAAKSAGASRPAGVGGGGLGGFGGRGGQGQAGAADALAATPTPSLAATQPAPPAPAANAATVYALDAEGNAQVVETVRRIGSKTFFRRGDRWVDSEITPEQEAKAQNLEQFSDAYFALARNQTASDNQYLTFEEPVTVLLNGQVYKIEKPKERRDG